MAMKTVNDIYNVAVENSTPMLSNYSSAFWENYVANYTYYDRLFRRSYLSFKYFLQLPDATAEDVLEEFTNEVYAHLLINDKKYTELYRLNNLSDSAYDFTKPYNMTESYSGQYEDDGTDVFGSATNTSTNVIGAREDTNTNVTGAREDSNTNVLGAREDSNTNVLGAREDTGTNVLGTRQDNETLTTGSQTTTNTNKVSPYDTDDFYNETENTDVVGGRTDNTSTSVGEQTNTESKTVGSQTNTENKTIGSQTNTENKTIGSQTNTETINVGEQTDTQTQIIGSKENTNHKAGNDSHTITRYGYDSRHLPTESLEAHEKFWSMYEFYAYIFSEICAELLIV